jgi:hypothetical protein
MSYVSKELLKNVVNRFTSNGHSTGSSYLIVKYFIGLNKNKISNYEEEIKKVTKSVVQNCKKK